MGYDFNPGEMPNNHFGNETTDFNPTMAANLNEFGKQVLGLPLKEVGCEVTVDGVHKTNRDIDVIAEEPVTETVIMIENQYHDNDPNHRNKILDYKQLYEREVDYIILTGYSFTDHDVNILVDEFATEVVPLEMRVIGDGLIFQTPNPKAHQAQVRMQREVQEKYEQDRQGITPEIIDMVDFPDGVRQTSNNDPYGFTVEHPNGDEITPNSADLKVDDRFDEMLLRTPFWYAGDGYDKQKVKDGIEVMKEKSFVDEVVNRSEFRNKPCVWIIWERWEQPYRHKREVAQRIGEVMEDLCGQIGEEIQEVAHR
jgi:hypothetical protein